MQNIGDKLDVDEENLDGGDDEGDLTDDENKEESDDDDDDDDDSDLNDENADDVVVEAVGENRELDVVGHSSIIAGVDCWYLRPVEWQISDVVVMTLIYVF